MSWDARFEDQDRNRWGRGQGGGERWPEDAAGRASSQAGARCERCGWTSTGSMRRDEDRERGDDRLWTREAGRGGYAEYGPAATSQRQARSQGWDRDRDDGRRFGGYEGQEAGRYHQGGGRYDERDERFGSEARDRGWEGGGAWGAGRDEGRPGYGASSSRSQWQDTGGRRWRDDDYDRGMGSGPAGADHRWSRDAGSYRDRSGRYAGGYARGFEGSRHGDPRARRNIDAYDGTERDMDTSIAMDRFDPIGAARSDPRPRHPSWSGSVENDEPARFGQSGATPFGFGW
jgi:hypothetical protein